MAEINKFKYRCVDCGATVYLSVTERSRASKPHCTECGSTFLDPVTKYARNRNMESYEAQTEQRERILEKMEMKGKQK